MAAVFGDGAGAGVAKPGGGPIRGEDGVFEGESGAGVGDKATWSKESSSSSGASSMTAVRSRGTFEGIKEGSLASLRFDSN